MNIQFELQILWLWKKICLYFKFLNDNSEFLKGPGLLVVTYKMHYVGTTFTMKMNSNDKILCGNIVNKQHINVLKWPLKSLIEVGLHLQLQLRRLFGLSEYQFFHIGRLWGFKCRCQAPFMFCVSLNPKFKLIYIGPAELPLNVISFY